ncbi:MAG: hypothetical protein PHF97_09120 [Bacteroidales bacterium]|nr:hypothetical protein [Bacteroidales bacterium]
MAKNLGNIVTSLHSGKFANISIQRNGVIRSLPDVSKRKWSPKQKQHLTRINESKDYARRVLADPEKSAHYSNLLPKYKKKIGKNNVGVYHLAIHDFFYPPEILRVALTQHSWDHSYYILIVTKDSFLTETVQVRLFKPNGEMLGCGEVNAGKSYGSYEYPIDPMCVTPGATVQISITDVPGRVVTETFTFQGQSSASSKPCLSLV